MALYTEEAPAEGWQQAKFDAVNWQQGPGGFGTEGTPGTAVRTRWASREIWLRREFELSAEVLTEEERSRLQLSLHHDDACEVYLNGVLAAKVDGFTVDYKSQPISAEARAALVPGRNMLAVHCAQTTGGQYIDVGLTAIDVPPTATGAEPSRT